MLNNQFFVKKTLLPYQGPTTTVFIDDDVDFLEELVFALNLEDAPHKVFDHPMQGVDFINQGTYRRYFHNALTQSDHDSDDDNLTFSTHNLLPFLKDSQRFTQISTLIVDYEMPGMKGVELCEKLNNPHVKKILLTGIADESIAVDAFNRGVIDRYVRKHDPNFVDILENCIADQQYDYFRKLLEIPLQTTRKRSDGTAISEPSFIDYFHKLLKKYDIQEYCMVDGMGSFLMIAKDKTPYSLITLDDDLIDAYSFFQGFENLSEKQKVSVQERKLIPCYYNPFEAPHLDTKDLGDYLKKPTVIEGEEKKFYSVFDKGLIQMGADDIVAWPVNKKR